MVAPNKHSHRYSHELLVNIVDIDISFSFCINNILIPKVKILLFTNSLDKTTPLANTGILPQSQIDGLKFNLQFSMLKARPSILRGLIHHHKYARSTWRMKYTPKVFPKYQGNRIAVWKSISTTAAPSFASETPPSDIDEVKVTKKKRTAPVKTMKHFKCTFNGCERAFASQGGLNRHTPQHDPNRPHGCTECGLRFNTNQILEQHVLTHTGEKPHKCTECGDAFAQSGNLESHMRTHSGEKPFKCTECDYAAAKSSSLTYHMRTHTGEK